MAKTFFITGTDTDVGKTVITTGLLVAAKAQGLSTAAVKPVAAGCDLIDGELRNGDALALQGAITEDIDYTQLNPVAFEPAIAPHIAAERAGKNITVSRLAGYCRGVMMRRADLTLIEGAGGWRVPLNPRETLADLAKELRSPVIIVVAMRLGCLNHALLTAEAIHRDGLQIAGWVANRVDPEMSCYEENLASLQQRIPFPCLGEVPYLPDLNPERVAEYLNLDALLS